MSKIIKREMRRSLPVIMIALVINLSVYGLVFNLTFGFDDALVKWLPSANADTASSTVTVKNAAPVLTNVIEVVASASNTPVNVGSSISFSASSTDIEGNNFYLLVCKAPGATPHATGGTPSCTTGGSLICVSASTTISGNASCTYGSITDPGAEFQNWYAYACDDYAQAGQADCSALNQGTGDAGSPYYVNHAPVIGSASTTDNYKNPGSNFIFTATSTDTDVAGANDVLTVEFCKTNSWTTGGGCTAGTWCTATTSANGASAVGMSCAASTTVPWPHGATTSYAFVKDWHTMPASNNSQSYTFTTNDVAPVIGSITLNSGNPILSNIKGAASTTVWATSTNVTDNNGCSDLVDATSTLYLSSVGPDCSANPNNCYQIGASNCAISSCAGGSTATVACSTDIAYYSVPTTASGTNPYAAQNWVSAITPYDQSSQTRGTSTPVELLVNTGIDVAEVSIVYGIMTANTNTGATTSTTTLINLGNSPIGADIIGTDMTGPATIAANNQKFATSSITYASMTYTLDTVTPRSLNMAIPRPTSSADVSSNVFWGIFVPAGRPSGNYSGTNTFSAYYNDNGSAVPWN